MAEWLNGIGDSKQITARVINSQQFPARGASLRFTMVGGINVQVLSEAGQPVAEVLDERSVLHLRHLLDTEQFYLAEVVQVVPAQQQIQVRVSTPLKRIPIAGSLVVMVSARLQKRIRNLFRKEVKDVEVNWEAWFSEQFIYHQKHLVFVNTAQEPERVSLLGLSLKLDCRTEAEAFLQATAVNHLPKARQRDELFQRASLLTGQVKWIFSESESPEVVQGALSLLKVAQSRSDYFKLWEDYRRLEQEATVEIARQLPPLTYHRLQFHPDVVRFYLDKGNSAQAWRDYSGSLSVELEVPTRRRAVDDSRGKINEITYPLGTVRAITADFIEVDRSDDEFGLPSRGRLRASVMGDAVRLARQSAALEQLRSGALPLRHLEKLLTVGDTDEIQSYSVPGFTSYPPRMADGRQPNDRQKQAVDMALNTPDICLIQGPPGTGKTTVIRTIIRRLKEVDRRQLLISSHQHTAVDKALEGMQQCGVVSFRVGGNRSSQDYRNDELEAWVNQVTQAVTANLKTMPQEVAYNRLMELAKVVESVAQYPNPERAQQVLALVLSGYGDLLPVTLQAQTHSLQAEFELIRTALPPQLTGNKKVADLEKWFRQLPAAVEADTDLQPLRYIAPLLDRLSQEQPEEQERAKNYRRCVSQISKLQSYLELSDDVETTRTTLTDTYDTVRNIVAEFLSAARTGDQPAAEETAYQPWLNQFRAWCLAVGDAVQEATEANRGQVPVILQQWLTELKSRPRRVARLFQKHADVLGVTCQQVVAHRFELHEEQFDNVVIDEAARTSPLDLLIPLVRARRIILVGDHMQLPHILEYRLEKEFEKAAANQTEFKNLLKQSLFERLYEKLPNTKKIRLNVQYRMNPVISRLVSDIFYADDPLQNDESTENLVNDTPLFNGRPVVWLDVKPPAGQSFEAGQFYNEAEVEQVIKCVAELVKGQTQRSIGVISYYAQQCDRIERALGNQMPGAHMVQVGSVDAFQGEEKDVILLSMVRSNAGRGPDSSPQIGFLAKPNRINVSLSRARRLLVLIGDSRTVTASPHLKQAYEYCQGLNSVLPKI